MFRSSSETGNNDTIDGATNHGFGRRIVSSPNADRIEELRLETSNFDGAAGYGTGLTVSMMPATAPTRCVALPSTRTKITR